MLDDREELLLSGDGQGDYGLRSAIATYLHRARGVNCDPQVSGAVLLLGYGRLSEDEMICGLTVLDAILS